jgi:ParB-like chromosome segregation protein Spo0J
MALQDLTPHPRNPRVHPDPGTPQWDALKASLAHDYFDPIVWNKRNGLLVSGHLRQKVLEADGYTHADVSVVDYDDATHLARLLAANKLQGEDELEGVEKILGELDASQVALELTGYAKDELDAICAAIPEDIEDDEEARPARQTYELSLPVNPRKGQIMLINGSEAKIRTAHRDGRTWNLKVVKL